MPDPFARLVPDAQAFCADLARNNNRDWWEANKARYEAALKAPALALLDALAGPLAELTGHAVTPKLFRPHRDMRFSRDKTPYHTHLHMMWTPDRGGRQDPVCFFGISPDHVTVGAGLMGFEPGPLADWRRMVELDGPRIEAVLGGVAKAGFALGPPELIRVPAPYPTDHPQADLLRRKGLVATATPVLSGDLATVLQTAFRRLNPLCDLLAEIAG